VVTYRDGMSESETSTSTPEIESRANHPRTRNLLTRHATTRKKLIAPGDRSQHQVDTHLDPSRQERLFPG
jgi:hypothetical protein